MAPSKALAKQGPVPAKKKSADIEQAAIVLDTIPTIEQVTQALEEKSKFFVEENDEGGESILLSKLRDAKNADAFFALARTAGLSIQ